MIDSGSVSSQQQPSSFVPAPGDLQPSHTSPWTCPRMESLHLAPLFPASACSDLRPHSLSLCTCSQYANLSVLLCPAMRWNYLLSTRNPRSQGVLATFPVCLPSTPASHYLVHCLPVSPTRHHGDRSQHPVNPCPPLRGGCTLGKSEFLLEPRFPG